MKHSDHTIILFEATALRGLRWCRRVYGSLTWEEINPDEQRHVLEHATCAPSLIAEANLERLGFWVDDEEIDVCLPGRRRQKTSPHIHVHSLSAAPPGAIVHVRGEVYALSPSAVVTSCTSGASFAQTLMFIEELCGSWSLPERELDEDELSATLDFLEKPCSYYESDPVLDLEGLRNFLDRSGSLRGKRRAAAAASLATGSSRSPMEAIMNCMFSLPHSHGGLNCGPLYANRRIDLPDNAASLAGLPYAIADAFLPLFRAVLEYNGSYHDERAIRRRDEARTLGLQSMGIDVYRLNDMQLKDARALESVARALYRNRGIRFRPRCKNFDAKIHALLKGLRAAVGLSA